MALRSGRFEYAVGHHFFPFEVSPLGRLQVLIFHASLLRCFVSSPHSAAMYTYRKMKSTVRIHRSTLMSLYFPAAILVMV